MIKRQATGLVLAARCGDLNGANPTLRRLLSHWKKIFSENLCEMQKNPLYDCAVEPLSVPNGGEAVGAYT